LTKKVRTHEAALKFVSWEDLQKHALDVA
jgi:hypothetical protein